MDSKIRGIIVVVRVYRIEDSIIDIPKLLGFIEVLSGTRFHAVMLLVNRLRYDISLFYIDSLKRGDIIEKPIINRKLIIKSYYITTWYCFTIDE